MNLREKIEVLALAFAVYVAVFTMGFHGCQEKLETVNGMLVDMGRSCG